MSSDKSNDIGAAAQATINNPRSLSQKLANPLAGLSPAQLSELAEEFCTERGITDEADVRVFHLGAQVAGSNSGWGTVEGLTDRERRVLRKEEENKWSNPKMLYLVVLSTFYP